MELRVWGERDKEMAREKHMQRVGTRLWVSKNPLTKRHPSLGLQREEELTSLLFSCPRGPCCPQ